MKLNEYVNDDKFQTILNCPCTVIIACTVEHDIKTPPPPSPKKKKLKYDIIVNLMSL